MSVETFMKPMSHDWGPATSRWRPIWKHEFMHTICREITNAIWTFTSLDVCFSFLVPAFPTIVQWCPTLNVILLLLRMCDRCLARQGKGAPLAMHYKNFSDNKAWPLTILSHEGYLHFDQFSLTPWLVVPGFKMENDMGFAAQHLPGNCQGFGGIWIENIGDAWVLRLLWGRAWHGHHPLPRRWKNPERLFEIQVSSFQVQKQEHLSLFIVDPRK